jgi:hypothetical protein
MDTRTHYRDLIKEIFQENAAIPVSYGNYRIQPVFDDENNHYLLMVYGVDRKRWEHHCLAHLEIRDNLIYFWWDGLEYSVAQELHDRGVPDEDMVLAYQMRTLPLETKPARIHQKQLVGVS